MHNYYQLLICTQKQLGNLINVILLVINAMSTIISLLLYISFYYLASYSLSEMFKFSDHAQLPGI